VTRRALVVALLLSPLAAACTPEAPDLSIRLESEDMKYRVISDPVPPHAREPIKYKVVVRDSKTGQPIEGGEGRIFATSHDNVNVWDALLPGEELGTYYGTLSFITNGEWAVAVQFRRDSTQVLQRVDWMQDVFPERPDVKPKQ
jgi:hypothetical protein